MKLTPGQLTERQRLFCQMYVGPGRHCAALAARLAGYAPGCSHVTGCQLLKKPHIAATVRGLEDDLAKAMEITRERVIESLLETFSMSRELQNPAAMISSMSNVAKILGYYTPEAKRLELGADDGLAHFERLSDSELLQLIAAGQAVAP